MENFCENIFEKVFQNQEYGNKEFYNHEARRKHRPFQS